MQRRESSQPAMRASAGRGGCLDQHIELCEAAERWDPPVLERSIHQAQAREASHERTDTNPRL